MKFRAVLVLCTLTLSASQYAATAAVKSGGTCTKSGQVSIANGKKFTCVKSKGKLIWNAGKAIVEVPTVDLSKLPVTPQVDLSNPSECKLKLGKNMPRLSNSISFPRPTVKGSTTSPRILVIGFSFNDASAVNIPQNDVKNITDQVTKFYSEQSFGQASLQFAFTPSDSNGVPQRIKLDRSIDSERLLRGGGPLDFPKFLRELLDNTAKEWNLHEYESVLFYPTDRRAIIGVSTQHSPETESNAIWEKPIPTKSGDIWAAVVATPDLYTFAHELAHALYRFYDLYSKDEGGSSAYTRGLDLMSGGGILQPFNEQLDFLSWHKWLAGWITDDQTLCLAKESTTNHLVTNLNKSDGKPKHIVVPVSTSKTVVVEVRNGTPIVYTVDSSISTGQVPVRVSNFVYKAGGQRITSLEGVLITINGCDKVSCNISVKTKGLSGAVQEEPNKGQNSAVGISIKEMSAIGSGLNSGEITFASENVKSYLIKLEPKEGQGQSWNSGIKTNSTNRTIVTASGLTCGITYKTTLTIYSQSEGKGESVEVINEGQLRTSPCG